MPYPDGSLGHMEGGLLACPGPRLSQFRLLPLRREELGEASSQEPLEGFEALEVNVGQGSDVEEESSG